MSPPFSRAGHPRSSSAGFEEDYEALRNGVGSLSLARDVLRVAGTDALDYLQGQCSQDLMALANGESADALVLSPQGKLESLVRVSRLGDEELVIDVDAGHGEALKLRLERFKLRVKAVIEPTGWTCLSLRGPQASDVVSGEAVGPGTSLVLRYEWNGVVGADLLGEAPAEPAATAPPSGIRSCGSDAWESLRVEAGIPVMGAELDDRTIAAEAGLLERCVSMTKGCYTGQELVARLDARGNRVARRLRGLVLDPETASADRGSGFTQGSEVLAGGKRAGSVTSVAWSPSLGTYVALCYLHRDVVPPCGVEVRTGPATEGGEVLLRAEARELPLVRAVPA